MRWLLPRLPVVNARETLGALYRAGFVFAHQAGGHVALKHPVSGRRATVPEHGGKDLKPGTLRTILRGAGLTVEEFIALL